MRQLSNVNPSPQDQCEVCRAARALVRASDVIRTAEINRAPIPAADAIRFDLAATAWAGVQDKRHTGTPHVAVSAP